MTGKRGWSVGGGLAFASALALGSMSMPGCTQKARAVMFVRQVQALQNPPQCTVTNDPTAAAVPEGVLDVALRGTYDAYLLVGNQMVARGSQDLVRAETSRIELTHAEVTLEDAAGTGLSAYTVPISGNLDPSTSDDPGFGLTLVPMVDGSTSSGLNSTLAINASRLLVSRVTLFGTTLGGTDVQSDEFDFTINACRGCTVVFDTDCKTASMTMTTSTCQMGQDGPTDCLQCATIAPEICKSPASP